MNNLQIRLVEFASGIYTAIEPIKNNGLMESSLIQIVKSSTSVGANPTLTTLALFENEAVELIKILSTISKKTQAIKK